MASNKAISLGRFASLHAGELRRYTVNIEGLENLHSIEPTEE